MTLPFPIPSDLSPEFTLTRLTAADLEGLIEVYYVAFQADRRNTFWWSDREPMMEWMRRRVRRKLNDRSVRHYKITGVKSGDLVAFARWDIPKGHEEAFGEWVGDDAAAVDVSGLVTESQEGENPPVNTAPVEAITPPAFDYPVGARPELCKVFFDALKNMSEKQNADSMLGLSLLCTSPKYHRKGAAKALMLPMLAIADARGLKTYLEATPDGKPVYERYGFREVDELLFDLKQLTSKFDESYKISIMVREPRPIS